MDEGGVRSPDAAEGEGPPRHHTWPAALERRRQRLWGSDDGLTALLVLVVLFVFVALPLDSMGLLGVWATTALNVWFAFIILAGVITISGRRSMAALVTVLLVAALSLHLTDKWIPTTKLDWLKAAIDLAVVSILVVLLLAHVYRAGPVTRQRIEGAIAVYLLLGILWSQVYFLMVLFDPGSLQGVSGPQDRMTSRLVYFSFVTLTSTGYGDVTPQTPFAQSLANLESIAGQLFPAVLLARLVSLTVSAGQARHDERS